MKVRLHSPGMHSSDIHAILQETDEGSLTWIRFVRTAECDSVHATTVELPCAYLANLGNSCGVIKKL